MKRRWLFLLGFFLIGSCRKIPELNQLTYNFVVITNRDKEANFGDYKTYFVSDTISYVSNEPDTDTIITGGAAATLVGTVKENMQSRGYILVGRTTYPDLGLKVTAVKQVATGVIYPPGWWWGYPGYPGGCYWGWCYPPYYPYPVTYAYKIGDLIIETYDLKHASKNQVLKIIWVADAGGVLSSTSSTNIELAVDGINKAFKQSPYFVTN